MLFWTIRVALAVIAALEVALCTVETAQKGQRAYSTKQPKPSKEVPCPLHRIAYVVSFNRKLYDFTRLNIAPVSEAQCLSICTKEQHLDGIKLLCSSVTYSARLRRCSIHSNTAKPRGKRQLAHDATTAYFEKFCLTEEAKRTCKSPLFYRVDNAKLPSAAGAISDQQIIAGCLNLCASKKDLCKSVTYLPEEKTCIMNDYSAAETGMQLHREPRKNVIYLENGCALKNQAKARKIHERYYSASAPPSIGPGSSQDVEQLLPALRPTISTKKLNLPKNKLTSVRTGQKGSQLGGQTKAKDVNLRAPSPATLVRPQFGSGGIKQSSNDNVFGSSANVRFVGDTGIPVSHTASAAPSWSNVMKPGGKYSTQHNLGDHGSLGAPSTFGTDHRSNFVGDSGLLRQSRTQHLTKESLEAARNGAVLLSSPESVVPSENPDDESRFSVSINPAETNTAKKTTSLNPVDLQKLKSPLSTGAGDAKNANMSPYLVSSPKESQLPTSAEGMPDETEITSPWSAWSLCSVFHTEQPCLGDQRLGFQARRCLASQKFCKGPLIRYCALPC